MKQNKEHFDYITPLCPVCNFIKTSFFLFLMAFFSAKALLKLIVSANIEIWSTPSRYDFTLRTKYLDRFTANRENF